MIFLFNVRRKEKAPGSNEVVLGQTAEKHLTAENMETPAKPVLFLSMINE